MTLDYGIEKVMSSKDETNDPEISSKLKIERVGRESEAHPAFRGKSFCHRLGAIA
jgi:hypothetical protein